MFIDRSKLGRTHTLEWRLRAFGVGAGLGVGGIITEIGWLVNAGIAVLAIGMLLRLIPAPEPLEASETDEDAAD